MKEKIMKKKTVIISFVVLAAISTAIAAYRANEPLPQPKPKAEAHQVAPKTDTGDSNENMEHFKNNT